MPDQLEHRLTGNQISWRARSAHEELMVAPCAPSAGLLNDDSRAAARLYVLCATVGHASVIPTTPNQHTSLGVLHELASWL